jgi:hypothetical protein
MPWRRIGEWRQSSTHSLATALDKGEWSASRPGRFIPRERAPLTHWIGGWVGPRAVLDAVVKGKIHSPRRESNPRTPIVQPVAQLYTDWAITARPVVLYGCEILSIILREVHKLRAFENNALKRTFGYRRHEVRGGGKNYIMKISTSCTLSQTLLGQSNGGGDE